MRKATLLADIENENVDLRNKLIELTQMNEQYLTQLAHLKTKFARESFETQNQQVERHNERAKKPSRFAIFKKKDAASLGDSQVSGD